MTGHDLLAEIDISADPALSLPQAHDTAESVRRRLLRDIRRLADATIHVSPCRAGQPTRITRPGLPRMA